jgi:hypothetical protein
MGKTSQLRREIELSFVPLAEARGFQVSRRKLPAFLDMRQVPPATVRPAS